VAPTGTPEASGDGATEPGALRVRDGRITAVVPAGDVLPSSVARAVRAVQEDLLLHPFLAPDAARLAELGLDRQALGAAVRAQQLARVGGDVYLLPDWVESAARLLASLDQPFTVSQARRALETTRRVAVPLLERLDAERVTARMADDRRVVRDRP
jgi:selenocysteine-specific elongation factor